jgi:hypothetical protein
MVLREWGPHAALPQLRQWWRLCYLLESQRNKLAHTTEKPKNTSIL